jgi:hypothetical protein
MKRTILIVGVVALLIAGYVSGQFDHPLYSVGLNFNECARNGFGATFCGSELDEYRERIDRAKVHGEEAVGKIKEEAANRKHESEERSTAERSEEEARLGAKMRKEHAIVNAEPEGSFAYDLAKDEYETARARLQQLHAGS